MLLRAGHDECLATPKPPRFGDEEMVLHCRWDTRKERMTESLADNGLPQDLAKASPSL